MRGAWLEQGVAVHAVIEEYEKSNRTLSEAQAKALYQDRYSAMVNESLKLQPDPEMWFNSGPYRGLPTDIERRYKVGQDQVAAYIAWSQDRNDESIWRNGVELKFVLRLEEVEVIGFIDLVIEHLKKGIGIRDVKTGQKPTEHEQLELYGLAIEELYDVEVPWGDYWLSPPPPRGQFKRKGHTTRAVSLPSAKKKQHFVEWFATMDAGVKSGDFRPTPGKNCERCPVQLSCEYRDQG